MTLAVSINDIHTAARRIEGHAVRTPLLFSDLLDRKLGGRVLIKPECLQRSGSFKFRGAFNRLSALDDAQKQAGVVAFSSGNHAQGVALAAQILGISAAIVMPSDAPEIKKQNTARYGAEIILYDRQSESREEIAATLAKDRGAVLVPSFEDPYVIAGQGTVGLEMAEDCQRLGITPDQALICCSGGGLSAGTALALTQSFPDTKCYTVEPAGFDDMRRSLITGEREGIEPGSASICDALLTPMPGALTLPILRAVGATGLTVSDDQVLAAMSAAQAYFKLVAEPGGAVALAAALSGATEIEGGIEGRTTLVVISGGNADLPMVERALAASADWR